jgi:ABC-2 type transport system permease protein
MNGSIVAKLVMKDLYLQRWLMYAALVVGVISIAICGINRVAFNVGSVFYLTTVIAYGVILVMYSVVQERKDKALLFVLSLPISGTQYLQAKMLAVLSTFCLPWAVLTLGGVLLIVVTPIQNGLLPFFILASTFMLMNFCVILAVSMLTVNEPLITAVIILTNLSVTLFFMLLAGIPAIQEHVDGSIAVWNAPAFAILAAEVIVMLIVLMLPFWRPLSFGRSVC